MTPSQYKTRYETLPVELARGTVKITVNQYRLRSKNYNEPVARAFLAKLKASGIDTELRIHTETGIVRISPELTRQERAFEKRTGVELGDFRIERGDDDVTVTTGVANWHLLARYVFAGKGSPEHCQIVLQLASAWGLAPDLQAYADSALGLDCNGFVGNYMWHVANHHPWTDLGVRNQDAGPDAWMTAFVPSAGKRLIAGWDELDPTRSYIMALVDSVGQVIVGGANSDTAHIVITEPNRRDDRPGTGGKPGSFAVRVVESTASHLPGLCETWYTCTSVRNKVFALHREEMSANQDRSFKIVAA